LGLSISRELAKLMGGSIEYSPRDDGDTGSVFIFMLPFEMPSTEKKPSRKANVSFFKGKEELVFFFLATVFHYYF